MRRTPIRLKLASALAIPLAALAIVSAIEVSRGAAEASDVRRQTDLARAVIGPAGLLSTLQNERTWPSVALIGSEQQITPMVAGYQETRQQTDDALEAFRGQLEDADDLIVRAYGPALEGLDGLEQLRADIDARPGPRTPTPDNITFANEIFERYTALIDPFFDAATEVSLEVGEDAELRQGAELADASARVIEELALVVRSAIIIGVLSPGGIDEGPEISQVATLHEAYRRQADTLLNASGPYADTAERLFPTALHESVDSTIREAISSGQVELPDVLAAVNASNEENYLPYETAVHERINERADTLNRDAERRRLAYAALAVVVVLAACVLTWFVSRSITRPLRSLTLQARAMAERGLPNAVRDILETPLGDDVTVPGIDPVSVRTRDEVGDVAEALNTVQSSALDLAVEQAVLRRNIADSFLSLGRRNQNLLSRQLDFITTLEAHEADPETLAALFRLDHLATRMRRNAESLLVLAGVEPARRWAEPVPVVDVIRSALGEVESYQRTTVTDVHPALVTGAAAADLAHLLAELVENALTFSPPDAPVDVRGRWTPGGAYALAVEDGGFGMSPADLARANRRLDGSESFTVAPSTYLGHYVAGNLAARHGIGIRLGAAPSTGGVVATVTLPAELMSEMPVSPAPVATREIGPPPTLARPDDEVPAYEAAPRSLPLGPVPLGPLPVAPSPVAPVAPSPVAPPPGWPASPADRDVVGAPAGPPPSPWSELAALAPARPTTPLVPAGHDAAGAGQTTGGLARRVRGAQLPTATPAPIPRGAQLPTATPAPLPRGEVPPDVDERAGDVYGFLSQFTAGVQRGLDETRGDGDDHRPPAAPDPYGPYDT